jgi:cadmium resistance protein CadD (predicted permease)
MHELEGGVGLIGVDNNFRSLPLLARQHIVSADLQVLVFMLTVMQLCCVASVSQIPNLTMRLRQSYGILALSFLAAPTSLKCFIFDLSSRTLSSLASNPAKASSASFIQT